MDIFKYLYNVHNCIATIDYLNYVRKFNLMHVHVYMRDRIKPISQLRFDYDTTTI